MSYCRPPLISVGRYYRSIAIIILDDTSIVGVTMTILFGTMIPISIAILQRYLRNDLHHVYSLEHGNSCNLSVCPIFDNVANFSD